MRRAQATVALAVAAMVVLAFAVPLGLVVQEMAGDRAFTRGRAPGRRDPARAGRPHRPRSVATGRGQHRRGRRRDRRARARAGRRGRRRSPVAAGSGPGAPPGAVSLSSDPRTPGLRRPVARCRWRQVGDGRPNGTARPYVLEAGRSGRRTGAPHHGAPGSRPVRHAGLDARVPPVTPRPRPCPSNLSSSAYAAPSGPRPGGRGPRGGCPARGRVLPGRRGRRAPR